jgi:hypothetical protein
MCGYAYPASACEAGGIAGRRVIVYPPDEHGGRRVHVDGVILGRASSLQDLGAFLERAGIEGWAEINPWVEDIVEASADVIEWRGGGPDAAAPCSGAGRGV